MLFQILYVAQFCSWDIAKSMLSAKDRLQKEDGHMNVTARWSHVPRPQRKSLIANFTQEELRPGWSSVW